MRHLLLFFSFFLLCLTSCKKDPETEGEKFTLNGTVVDEAGVALAGVVVAAGNASTSTGTDGAFVLENVNSSTSTFQVSANKAGYFTAFRNVDNIDGSSLYTRVMMLAKSPLGTIPTAGGQAAAGGVRVTAPAGAFRKADGTTYNGPVSVTYKYVAANNPNMAMAMPGGDFLATDATGTEGGMRTYGFTVTEFVDSNGNALTPSANVTVGMTLPAGTPLPATTGARGWSFNESTGRWGSESAVTTTGTEVSMPGNARFKNLDRFVRFGTIEGLVQCADGRPVRNVEVTVSNANNRYVVFTNATGKYRVRVESNASTGTSNYTVTASGQSVSVAAPATNSTVTAPAITSTVAPCATTGGGTGSTGTGSFTVNGQTQSGICMSTQTTISGCTGVDVVIATTTGTSYIFYNMPTQSSGSFPITNALQNLNTCTLYTLAQPVAGTQYGSVSGTLTKTGARSFTFSGSVQNHSTNQTVSASGSGNW